MNLNGPNHEKFTVSIIFLTLCYRVLAQDKRILVEAEHFDQKGGWLVDQ